MLILENIEDAKIKLLEAEKNLAEVIKDAFPIGSEVCWETWGETKTGRIVEYSYWECPYCVRRGITSVIIQSKGPLKIAHKVKVNRITSVKKGK
jgi:hypothetical protein